MCTSGISLVETKIKQMKNIKVIKITEDSLEFEGGITIYSEHEQDCCESHYLYFKDLTMSDFEGLEFDLSTEQFFERIPDYGIALLPLNGMPVRIPGYGSNNGYYSSNLSLVVSDGGKVQAEYGITECQVIND